MRMRFLVLSILVHCGLAAAVLILSTLNLKIVFNAAKNSESIRSTLDQFPWPNEELSLLFSTTFAYACFRSGPLCR
jgi:hypothetical protein